MIDRLDMVHDVRVVAVVVRCDADAHYGVNMKLFGVRIVNTSAHNIQRAN